MWNRHNRNDVIRISSFYTIFEHNCEPGYNFYGEAHDFWEMVYVIDGEISVTAGSDVYNLKKNALIFHKPLVFHKFRADSEKGARLFIISFEASGSAIEYIGGLTVYLSHRQTEDISQMIDYCRSHIDNYDAKREMNDFVPSLCSVPSYLQSVCVFTEKLILSLYENNANKISRLHSEDARIFSQAVEHIEMNDERFLSVPELARLCGVSVTKLKNIFYVHTGLAPHSYCIKTKILKAKQLFSEGFNVEETSRRLGFCNPYYFSTVFKRETGITPSSYIKGL